MKSPLTLPMGGPARGRLFRAFMLVAAALACFALPAAASEQAGEQVAYTSLDQSRQLAVIENLVRAGDMQRAQFLLSNSRFDERDLGYQAAFLQAVIWRATGRLADAEKLLRQVLAERPGFDRVRLELANVMAERGNREGALYNLKLLSDSAQNETARANLETFIDALDAERPFAFGGFITVAPSTNVNSGSNGSIIRIGRLPFAIDPKARKTSGIGVRGGLNASYSHALTAASTAYVAGSVSGSEYRGSTFDRHRVELRAGLRTKFSRATLSAEAIANRQWLAWNGSDTGFGGRIFGSLVLTPSLLASGEVKYIQRDFESALPDAKTWVAEAGLHRGWSAATTSSFKLRGVRQTQGAARHNAFREVAVELGATHQAAFGISLSGRVIAGRRQFDALFPGSTEKRRDRHARVELSLLKRDWVVRGFTPRLTLSYTRQSSNVVLFDHDKAGVDITLSKSF